MTHHHRTEADLLRLVLYLRQLHLPVEEILSRAVDAILTARPAESERKAQILAELDEVQSCAICRHGFERMWEEQAEEVTGIVYPDVIPLVRRDLRQRTPMEQPAGHAAAPEPEGSPCEITCVGPGMLVRILAEPDGSATAILLLSEGSPEGVILRVDGREEEFPASGVLRLSRLPVHIGLERRPPRPGGD